jgi:hypothetical protein
MDIADLYVDGLSIGVGPFGYTVTFLRSEPTTTDPGEQQVTNLPVIRLRFSRDFARQLRDSMEASLASPQPEPGGFVVGGPPTQG